MSATEDVWTDLVREATNAHTRAANQDELHDMALNAQRQQEQQQQRQRQRQQRPPPPPPAAAQAAQARRRAARAAAARDHDRAARLDDADRRHLKSLAPPSAHAHAQAQTFTAANVRQRLCAAEGAAAAYHALNTPDDYTVLAPATGCR